MPYRVSILYNPIAGKNRGEAAARRTARILEAKGFGDCRLHKSQGAEHLERLARGASGECDVIVVVGGDGSFYRVVNGMTRRDLPLGLIPCGTGNGVAQEFRLGTTVEEAVQSILRNRPRFVDALCANGRLSVMMVGAGLQAEVDRRVHEQRPARFMSIFRYLPPLIDIVRYWETPRMTVEADGRRLADWADDVMVANIAHHGGPFTVAVSAKPDDGLMDVWIFRCGRRRNILRTALAAMFRMHVASRSVTHCQARRVTITGDKPYSYHIDGDPVGETPLEISIEPKAIRLFC